MREECRRPAGRDSAGYGRVAIGDEGVVELTVPVVEHAAEIEQERVVADPLEFLLVLLPQPVQGGVGVLRQKLAGPTRLDQGFIPLPEVDVVQPLEVGHQGHLEGPGPVTDGVVVGKKGKGALGKGLRV